MQHILIADLNERQYKYFQKFEVISLTGDYLFFCNKKIEMRNETYSYDEVELMAIYENVSKIPNENRVTSWWGDMDMYEFKFGVKESEVKARFN